VIFNRNSQANASFFLLMTLTACASGPSIYEQEIEIHRQEAKNLFISPECKTGPKFQENCGEVVDIDNNAFKEFAQENCINSNKKFDVCWDGFWKHTIARWQLRYKYANWAEVTTLCTAYPDKCSPLYVLELQIQLSHNQAVVTIFKQQSDVVSRQAELDALERRKSSIDAMQALGRSMQNSSQSTNCMSYQVGNIVNTSCR